MNLKHCFIVLHGSRDLLLYKCQYYIRKLLANSALSSLKGEGEGWHGLVWERGFKRLPIYSYWTNEITCVVVMNLVTGGRDTIK